MNKRNIIIILIFVVILGAGIVAFLMVSQEKELSIPGLPFTQSSTEDLKGKWKVEEMFVLDPETKEFKAIPRPQGQQDMYAQFSEDQFCQGYFDDKGQLKPCEKYNQMAVSGDTFTISDDPNLSQALFRWKIKGNELELLMEARDPASVPADQPSKIKFIFSRMK